MKHKNSISVIGILIVIAMLVSACGQQATPTAGPANETQPTQVSQTESTTKEEPTIEAVPAGQSTEIWIVSSYPEGSGSQPYLVDITKEFEAAHPNIKVKWEWAGYDLYDQKIRGYIESGNSPDSVVGAISVLIQYAKEGITIPLDQYFDQQNYEGDAVWKDSFPSSLMDQNYIEDAKNGPGYYAVPTQMHVAGIFYNVKIFNDLGLKPPATIQEMMDTCQKITDSGLYCFGVDGGFTPYITIPFAYIAGRVGGEQAYYDTALHKEGTSWTDNPDWLKAAELTQQLYNFHQPGFLGYAWPAAQAEFAQGRMAMMYIPTWLPAELVGVAPDDFQMVMFRWPAYEGGKGDQTATQLNFNGYSLAVGGKHPQETIEFLKFLSSRHVTEGEAERYLTPSPTIGAKLPASLAEVEAIMKSSKMVPEGMGVDNDASEWRTAVLEPLLSELALGMEPAEFIKEMQSQSDDYYAKK